MGKAVFIAEKPSVAREFAKALKENFKTGDGFMESENYVVTWCVGHLITMSYPDVYDPELKKWRMETLPFIPGEFKYEVISAVEKQFNIVKKQLTREDVETIYVCTDSGREGEYIYRLVKQEAGVSNKKERRVWIDSQTEEEIIKGIKNAKDLSEYDNLSDAAYLRAIEDYLMGINFSRVMTLQFGNIISGALARRSSVIAMGRVMTCVLGMVVKREREIRAFVPTPFYKVNAETEFGFTAEWKVADSSLYAASDKLYKENGFLRKEDAYNLVELVGGNDPHIARVLSFSKKKESVKPPLLYNLAELQNDCSRIFKISPDETLKIAQELYEKKLTTYPRTDARVVSIAVCKEIAKNLTGLTGYGTAAVFAKEILENGTYKDLARSRYCDDKKITDHYAIIPTGAGMGGLNAVSSLTQKVYELIVRRFLSIFYPPADYQKTSLGLGIGSDGNRSDPELADLSGKAGEETFTANFKVLVEEGFLKISKNSFDKKKKEETDIPDAVKSLKKNTEVKISGFEIKESETSPPKRYNSGSMILAMENAGQVIEDEELRAQIKGSGIGTSATRAEILKKLNSIKYINTNAKTQILTPTLFGEIIYDATDLSLPHLLSPELTASWEKGLNYVANGEITSDEYMEKLEGFVARRTRSVINSGKSGELYGRIKLLKEEYRKETK